MKSFTDLHTWQKGHQLVLLVYRVTKLFPSEERYSLTDQLRRASVSITSNIAEGFGRSGARDKVRFYIIARGSLIEVQNQFLIARDVGYLTNKDFQELGAVSVEVHKMLNGLIRSTRKHLK